VDSRSQSAIYFFIIGDKYFNSKIYLLVRIEVQIQVRGSNPDHFVKTDRGLNLFNFTHNNKLINAKETYSNTNNGLVRLTSAYVTAKVAFLYHPKSKVVPFL